MAAQVLSTAKCWLDGYDLSGDLNKLGLSAAVETKDATVFGDVGRRRRPGLRSIVAHHAGFWSGGALGIDDLLVTNIAVANVPMSLAPLTGAAGEPAYTLRCLLGEYTPGAAVGDLLAFDVAGEGSAGEPLVRGTILSNVTASGSGSGTAYQLGAVGATQSLYAALHVLAASGGAPTLDVTIQSDALVGMGSPALVTTFPQMTARGSAWAPVVVGPLADDWYRVAFVISGATPSFTFVVIVGAAP